MDGGPDTLSTAWRDAAVDLRLEVHAPFSLAGGASCVAWVASFGSPRGTLVAARLSDNAHVRAWAGSHGMYCSEIDEVAYARYDRDLFVATLTDWGWCGDVPAAPSWYVGPFSPR